MMPILYNDIQFSSYVDFILDNEESTEEEKAMLLQAKVENEMQSNQTIDSMLWACDRKQSKIDQLKEKRKQIDFWIKQEENKINWIESNIKNYMEVKGIKEIESDTYKIKIVNNGGKRRINYKVDINNIPSKYVVVEMIKRIESDEVYKLLEKESVEWAELEPRGTRLNYK